MGKNKILVFDDEPRLEKRYTKMLKEVEVLNDFDIEPLTTDKFTEEMKILGGRRSKFRKGEGFEYSNSEIDEASILVIDYDLFGVSGDGSLPFPTGEIIAYLTRCFSRCDLIIGLNQFGTNDFDLTLKGHLESYADLNVGWKQLNNKGFWSGVTKDFRPSYWPQLIDYLASFKKKMNDVKENVKKPILKTIGIPDEIVEILPSSITGFLGDDPLKKTFEKFVTKSGNGLNRKDSNEDPIKGLTGETVSRIGAARISKWIERLLLPGQNFLVDAPHLVSRFPSLLEGDPSKVETWDNTCKFVGHKKLGLKDITIEKQRFKKDFWVSRPVWFWKSVSENHEIKEVTDPWERKRTNFVFCEDANRFYKKRFCHEFLADLDSPYIHRYVRRFGGIKYHPTVRFL